MRGMEKIATDTYSFERIREGGFVYVDKTAIMKTLAAGNPDGKMVLLVDEYDKPLLGHLERPHCQARVPPCPREPRARRTSHCVTRLRGRNR